MVPVGSAIGWRCGVSTTSFTTLQVAPMKAGRSVRAVKRFQTSQVHLRKSSLGQPRQLRRSPSSMSDVQFRLSPGLPYRPIGCPHHMALGHMPARLGVRMPPLGVLMSRPSCQSQRHLTISAFRRVSPNSGHRSGARRATQPRHGARSARAQPPPRSKGSTDRGNAATPGLARFSCSFYALDMAAAANASTREQRAAILTSPLP